MDLRIKIREILLKLHFVQAVVRREVEVPYRLSRAQGPSGRRPTHPETTFRHLVDEQRKNRFVNFDFYSYNLLTIAQWIE